MLEKWINIFFALFIVLCIGHKAKANTLRPIVVKSYKNKVLNLELNLEKLAKTGNGAVLKIQKNEKLTDLYKLKIPKRIARIKKKDKKILKGKIKKNSENNKIEFKIRLTRQSIETLEEQGNLEIGLFKSRVDGVSKLERINIKEEFLIK